ncbi:Voltage-dependent calcium channel gamma-5 subunit [Aphelenchoides bicaudatus]|nr:Voltage-dependent calcium channel gamma-5 subunit [Aphelenchoides bicaudatus]
MMNEEEESSSFETSPLSEPMAKFVYDSPHGSQHLSNRLENTCDCSGSYLVWASRFLGVLAILMQIPPLFLLNWIEIQEPKTVNQTNDQGELLEAPFTFRLGYFQVCREPAENMTEFKVDPIKVRRNFPKLCVMNPVFTDDDLSDYSFVSSIILSRLLVPAILQILGCGLGIVALFLSFVGQIKHNKQSIYASFCYITSALFIFVAVLQFICAVDDEMNARMKPTLTGEPSSFDFKYGPSFLSTSLSFLPLQVCVYLQTKIYFDRYPLPLDTAQIVPGLGEMLSEIISRSKRGLPVSNSFSSYRRDSRCSREAAFGGIQQDIHCLAPPSFTGETTVKPAIHFCI